METFWKWVSLWEHEEKKNRSLARRNKPTTIVFLNGVAIHDASKTDSLEKFVRQWQAGR